LFQFLNPIWLFGAAALLIPVVIHLWNVRSGKVLKVGSISLIKAASRKSSRSFKLLDILLFVLRCLLLLLLALLLALPVWQKIVQAKKVKGWVLIPKENLAATYQKFKIRIDSLTKAGYAFHYFNSGFAKSNLQQILLHPKDSLSNSFSAPQALPNYWNLAKQLNNSVDAKLPLYVFTPNQARYFGSTRPEVALNMIWQTYTPADSVANYIQEAWFTNTGSIRVVKGTSTPLGTTYMYNNIGANETRNTAFTINTKNGKAEISLPDNKLQQAVIIDTAVQSIIIYAGNNTTDARYMEAALRAVSQFTQRNIRIKSVNSPNQIPAHTAWLFWLSDGAINNQTINNCQNILTYEKGRPTAVKSWISSGGRFSTALPDDAKVDLFRLISSKHNYEIVWRDGFGQPVLSRQPQNKTNIYHFYSRFNPSWNDLVWSESFPAWMLELIASQLKTDEDVYDRRVLSRQQCMPQIISGKHTLATTKSVENKSLDRYFWLALVIIFAAERWLAHRPSTNMTT
jgi:hypothetical protein